MINIIDNNESIYLLLEKHKLLPPDFSSDAVTELDVDGMYHLSIYNASTRNFILYVSNNYMKDISELSEMMILIQEGSETLFSESIAQKAINLLEDKIHSRNSSRFFFDAH
ncbi:MAG: hypothetical protein L6Q66_03380 [Bacteroidia bacterium]|nr:hypothetical protein [Bacteroidia bacterium]